jgi:diguanylate cyclase (GGDEF)-like protein
VALRRGHRLGVAFDIAVFAAGGAIAAVDAAGLLLRGARVNPALLVAIPVIVVIGRFPIRVHGLGGQMEFVCTPAVLTFLAFQAPAAVASALWTLGYAVEQGLSRRPVPSKLFNIGLAAIAGRLTITVTGALATSRLDARSLLAVLAGTGGYFAADFLLTYASVWMFQPVRLRNLLRDPAIGIALAGLVGATAIGYTGTVLAHVRWFALLLTAPPIGAMFLASQAYDQANRHRSRLEGLFHAAVLTHQADRPEEIESVLVRQACDLLHAPETRMRAAAPTGDEAGVLVTALGDRYLVAPPRRAGPSYDEVDRASLATLVAIATESLDRSRLAADLARLARRDPLTGLGNRTLFQERLDRALLLRAGHPRPLTLLYLDLDGFKPVNDTLGHDVGDALLTAVGHRILGLVRAGDTVARLGGDEFAVLLEEEGEEAPPDAAEVCGRMAEAIAAPVGIGAHLVRVSVSIGAAAWVPGDTADELVRRADREMYRHKRGARPAAGDTVPAAANAVPAVTDTVPAAG